MKRESKKDVVPRNMGDIEGGGAMRREGRSTDILRREGEKNGAGFP